MTNAALEMFRDQIFMPNLQFLRSAILEEIRKDRDQEIVEIDLIKSAINHFVVIDYKRPPNDDKGQKVEILLKKGQEFEWLGTKSLEIYDNELQRQLMAETTQFFQDKSKHWRESQTCHEYVLNTQHAL